MLSEKPERVRALFLSDQMNEQGVFGVKFYKNGLCHEIVVDDLFPCKDNNTIMSRAYKNHVLWVTVLEKAWAKVHGCYERVSGGMCLNVMRDLTGAPSFFYDLQKTDEDVFEQILAYDGMDYIMTAGALEAENMDELRDVGLVAAHAYGLIAAKKITDKDGDEARLLLLRNPWGKFEWTGKWNDNSDCWTPELKEEVGFVEDDDDGLFWICFEDMKEYFRSVSICKVKDSYIYSNCAVKQSQGSFTLLKLSVTGDGEHTISVSQKDERCFSRSSGYEY